MLKLNIGAFLKFIFLLSRLFKREAYTMKSILTILQLQYDLIEKELIRYQNNPYDADQTHNLHIAQVQKKVYNSDN